MSFKPDEYKSSVKTLKKNCSSTCSQRVVVREIPLPDLSIPMKLPYTHQFSVLEPKHREMASKLIGLFLKMADLEDLLSICSYCQMNINPYMFNYCLSVAILHRKDTKGMDIPNFAESFPYKFIDPVVYNKAREVANIDTHKKKRPIVIPQLFTANACEPEQRVGYFREDIGVNLHHWHWHLVYPNVGDISIVKKDRRGELFYYMHQQILARYNVERLCNGLTRVYTYKSLRQPIKEGYFPKLTCQVSSRALPSRFADTRIRNVDRPIDKTKLDVFQAELWMDRLTEAINNMAIILPTGESMPLDEETGIDVLGNMVESCLLSKNSDYYGDLHNAGHMFVAYSHDPDQRFKEGAGVMGDTSTAMRDPIFYRWHTYINDLFVLYKNKLQPYPRKTLKFPGIRVRSINIEGPSGNNVITTKWQQSAVELSKGLDFAKRVNVKASFTHLQHDGFNYIIKVKNTIGKEVNGTVRLFLGPKLDENDQPLSFDEQRRLMIEMDKFTCSFPIGKSVITRKSVDSSVTIPYDRVYRDQSKRPGDAGSAEAAAFDFCGCGWPHYMLVPKGTHHGYPMVLFCMISNWEDDKVDSDPKGTCKDAASYCGLRNSKYPDRKAMGYPFDRITQAESLKEFLTRNMAVVDCSIQFTNKTQRWQ